MIDLEIVKIIQSLRNPIFDWFFYVVTQFGDQIFLIIFLGIIYWAYDQKYAFKIAMGLTLSTLLTLSLKEIIQRPRPYLSEGVDSVDLPHVKTPGYSFPSGHAQSAGVSSFVFYDLYVTHKKKIFKIITITFLICIPLSRVYLGQHYVTDVVSGLILSIFLMHHTFKWFSKHEDEAHRYALYATPFFLSLLFIFKSEIIYQASGAWIGFVFGHYVHVTKIGLKKHQKITQNITKVFIGLMGVFILKEGLKMLMPHLLVFDFLRYLLIGVWASFGAPLVFKYVIKDN